MPTTTDELTTISMVSDKYENTLHAVDASKLENGPKTPEQQEYERVKNIRLDGDLDNVPIPEMVNLIQARLNKLMKSEATPKETKKAYEFGYKSIDTWVKRLDPEAHAEDKDIFYAMPKENREAVLKLYKREIADSLTTMSTLMTTFNNYESRVVATTLVRSKTTELDLSLQEIYVDLRENLDKERTPDEKVALIATTLHDLHNMGPIPFRSFVTEQFGGIDVNNPESLAEINARIDKLEHTRTKVHQKTIEVFDENLKPSARETFERVVDPEKRSNEYRWLNADRSRGLDCTIANKYVDKSVWRGEVQHETKQYVNLTPGTAEKPRADRKVEHVKVDMVDITIFAEETVREKRGLDMGTALMHNPYTENKLYNVRASSLEAIYHELERWNNHKVLGANGEEVKPIYVDKATGKVYADKEQTQIIPQPLKYRILVPGMDTLGNKIDETLDVDQKTMNRVLVALSTAQRDWELKGFKVDPEKLKLVEEMEYPTSRIEQLRQKSFVEETYDKVIAEKRALGELDDSQIALYETARDRSSDMYEKFIQRYGRMDEYRKIAETRVREKGIPENTMPWVHEVEQEIYNVVVEMTQLERVLRNVTLDVLAYTRHEQPGSDQLDRLLINLDNEITARLATKLIAMREGTYDLSLIQTQVRTLLGPYIRKPTDVRPDTISSIILHPTESIPQPPTIEEMKMFFAFHRDQDENADLKVTAEIVNEEQENRKYNINVTHLLPSGPLPESEIVDGEFTVAAVSENEWPDLEERNRAAIEKAIEAARELANERQEEDGEFTYAFDPKYALTEKVEETLVERAQSTQEAQLEKAKGILLDRTDILNPNRFNEVNETLTSIGMEPLTEEAFEALEQESQAEIDAILETLMMEALADVDKQNANMQNVE